MWKNIWWAASSPIRYAGLRMMLKRLSTYASFVRVSHSVFALPFALAGALLAAQHTAVTWGAVGWILVAMVAARSAAMGFNRLVDARMDALNPRTANREIPRGAMSLREAAIFVVVSSAVFVARVVAAEPALLRAVAGGARHRVLVLARQALHHLDAAVSRAWRWPSRRSAAGWRSAGAAAGSRGCWPRRSAPGSAASTCCMPVRISSSIARTACNSIPVRFGVRTSLAISRVMHVVAVSLPARARLRRAAGRRLSGRRRRGRGDARLRAVAGARRRSVAGEARVRSERLRRHPVSAGADGRRSMAPGSTDRAAGDRDRDHRRERRGLRDPDGRGAARARRPRRADRLGLRPPAAARRARRAGVDRSARCRS